MKYSYPKYPARQPQPTTPIRGPGLVACDFHSDALRRLAKKLKTKLNSKWAVLKPKRNSRGIIWRNHVYWWSVKGYYRPGKSMAGDKRRPLQHSIWEFYHQQKMPPGCEIFFMDRDRHNFTRRNLRLMSKSELHHKTIELGEVPQPSNEFKQQIADRRWSRVGKQRTDGLLNRFNAGEQFDAALLTTVK